MSAKENTWLTYWLEELEFHNGALLKLANARMRYSTDATEIKIEFPHGGPAPLALDAAIKRVGAEHSPIKTIRYEMDAEGFPRCAFFYHPLRAGARVFLQPRPRGQNALVFNQAEARTIFSKDWTLREVTGGKIPIDRPVWQFHGYKHEH